MVKKYVLKLTAGSGSDVVKTVDKAFGFRLLVETVNDAFLAVDNAEHIEAAAGWVDFITDATAHFLSPYRVVRCRREIGYSDGWKRSGRA